MAFSGLHVICAYAGAYADRHLSQSILGKINWSEAPASATITTNAAPGATDAMGQAIFRINAAVDSWVSVGKAPDETGATAPRFLVRAGSDYDVFVDAGFKLKWVAA